jgi:C-terminal processing protease CtpA/Prc
MVPAITVRDCHPGCPVDLDGKIKIGDKLVRVDGELVIGMPLDSIYSLILGDIGTEVCCLF